MGSVTAMHGMPAIASASGTSFEVRLRAQILAALYGAGATLVLLTVALPHAARANELGLIGISANAYVIAAGLLWRSSRMPTAVLFATLAWGSTLITGVAYFFAEIPSPHVFFYLWIFLYSAYFFTKRGAGVQIAYVGVLYGALLAVRPPAGGLVAWWVVAMGAMLVAALVIRAMRDRVELLIARLYDAARTDPLTQLSNRRGFREQLDLELERARRGGTDMTVVVGDLDHFKDVNDRAGHHAGDAVLRRVAGLLREGQRRIDAAARVGGEEFALILPDTEAGGGHVLAERLRETIRDAFADEAVPVTISFGIASYPVHGETAASLLRAADDALYGAKESGRNRTLVHDASLRGMRSDEHEEHDVGGERFLTAVLDLAEAIDLRFSGSARHSETVGRYAEMMARELGLSEQRVGRVRLAGLLHDLGKVAVPDAILLKPGKLTEPEFAVIRQHPGLGAQMLQHPSLADVQAWVGAHHERPDGGGYPHGLAGTALPLEARIVAVADAYEAMTSDRPYRASIGRDAAYAELERCSGSQFDASVVAAFVTVLQRESERALHLT